MSFFNRFSLLLVCVFATTALPPLAAEEFFLSDDIAPNDRISRPTQRVNAWHVEAGYFVGWTNGAYAPALVTTSANNSLRSQAGVLTNPTTRVLFGDGTIDTGNRSGTRITASQLLNNDVRLYVGGMYLGDDKQSGNFLASSSGLPILARPFIDAQTNLQNAELVAFPSVLAGTVAVNSFSEMFLGDVGIERALMQGTKGELYAIGGYRYLSFRENLTVREDLRSIDLAGLIPLDTTFLVQDTFAARNEFHSGNMGFGLRITHHRFNYGVSACVALGRFAHRTQIGGQTNVTVPGQAVDIQQGGLLAQPTNIGTYDRHSFAAIPEFRARLGRQVTENFSLDVGYDFLLLPGVWRAGEQIDSTVNRSQIGGGMLSGPARPAFIADSTDTWVQGLRFGISLDW